MLIWGCTYTITDNLFIFSLSSGSSRRSGNKSAISGSDGNLQGETDIQNEPSSHLRTMTAEMVSLVKVTFSEKGTKMTPSLIIVILLIYVV